MKDYDEMILKFLKDFTECAHSMVKFKSQHNIAFDEDDDDEEDEFKKEMRFFGALSQHIESEEEIAEVNSEE